MKKIYLLSLVLTFALICNAQFTLQGKLADTSQSLVLEKASISISRLKDSILVRHTRAKNDGSFEMLNLPADQYLLQITYPGYADFTDILNFNNHTNLGLINMITRAVALQNVIVRGSPIRMKGDTLSFLADSFKVREGDNVEALLKRLPGLQVNSKGEITAQGEQVKRVLVDGDEFFGDDPTLATRNIRADMVKEVQVFDRKSDQATFTGVDDGQVEKTINLKLKEDAKNGNFGKISAGGGLPDNYKNDAMANVFKGKRKISAYGLMSNVDRGGLDWNQENNYGGNMNEDMMYGDNGDIMIFSGNDDLDNGANMLNEGLPTAWTAGMHFSDKWNETKNSVNGSYRIRNIQTEGGSRTTTQFILPDTQFFNNEMAKFDAVRLQQKVRGQVLLQLDSMQSLQFKVNGNHGRNQTVGNFITEALEPSGNLVNDGARQNTNENTLLAFGTEALYKRKFKKRGRTLSVNLSQNYSSDIGEGFLLNVNRFYKGGIPIGIDTTDQKKKDDLKNSQLNGKLSYTEGLGKKGIVETSYQYTYQSNDNERLTFDKENGQYTKLNNLFSNSFLFKSHTHNGGLGYRYSTKTINFGLGGNVAVSDWNQKDVLRDTTQNLQFVNFLGRANFFYKIKPQTSIRFNYNANTRNPTISQLQPILDNQNPLFIRVGNPNLKLSFNQSFNLGFNDYKTISGRYLYANINVSTITNAFSTREFVDSIGRRVSQTINVNGNYNISSFFGYNRRIGKSGLSLNIDGGYNRSRNNNIVNNIKNENNNQSFNLSLGAGSWEKETLQYNVGLRSTYNTITSSIRPDVVTNFWTLQPNVYIQSQLGKKWRIETEFNYEWRQKTSVFDQNNNVALWNMSAKRKLFDKKDIWLGVTVNDLLNQNVGFNRQITSNFVTEQNWLVVRQYWLVTLVWNFSKNGKPTEW
jgi:outer membrane receptor protein involved in Fe transport